MAYYTGYGFYSVCSEFCDLCFGSGGVLFLVEPAITNYGDGLWYAFVTLTTVGYGISSCDLDWKDYQCLLDDLWAHIFLAVYQLLF